MVGWPLNPRQWDVESLGEMDPGPMSSLRLVGLRMGFHNALNPFTEFSVTDAGILCETPRYLPHGANIALSGDPAGDHKVRDVPQTRKSGLLRPAHRKPGLLDQGSKYFFGRRCQPTRGIRSKQDLSDPYR